eukprot:gene4576-5713_t
MSTVKNGVIEPGVIPIGVEDLDVGLFTYESKKKFKSSFSLQPDTVPSSIRHLTIGHKDDSRAPNCFLLNFDYKFPDSLVDLHLNSFCGLIHSNLPKGLQTLELFCWNPDNKLYGDSCSKLSLHSDHSLNSSSDFNLQSPLYEICITVINPELLYRPKIPPTVEKLTIDIFYLIDPIPKGFIPDSVKELTLDYLGQPYEYFNSSQFIEAANLDQQEEVEDVDITEDQKNFFNPHDPTGYYYTKLYCKERWNRKVIEMESIPGSVEKLRISHHLFKENTNFIPTSVTHLEVTQWNYQSGDQLKSEMIPKSVRTLKLVNDCRVLKRKNSMIEHGVIPFGVKELYIGLFRFKGEKVISLPENLIPESVRKLVISPINSDISKRVQYLELEPGVIPKSVIDLELDIGLFDFTIKPNSIPEGIQRLSLLNSTRISFNSLFKGGEMKNLPYLPQSITQLKLESFKSEFLSSIPVNIQELNITINFLENKEIIDFQSTIDSILQLPNLTHLSLILDSTSIVFTPSSMTSFKSSFKSGGKPDLPTPTNYEFTFPSKSTPTFKSLSISWELHKPIFKIDKLPDTLESLELPSSHIFTSDKVPLSLRSLKIKKTKELFSSPTTLPDLLSELLLSNNRPNGIRIETEEFGNSKFYSLSSDDQYIYHTDSLSKLENFVKKSNFKSYLLSISNKFY